MGLGDIISDSVQYPFSDIQKFLIVGVISLFSGLSSLFGNWGVDSFILITLAGIIGLIFTLMLSGYSISVTKYAINHSSQLPDLDFQNNLIDGIKALIISIVYFIIPIIITLIFAIITGAIGAGLNQLVAGLGVFAVIAVIVFIFFAIFEIVALARFADTGELGEALNIGEVIEDVKKIGIGKIILFAIVSVIIIIIASLIVSLLGIIPFIGILIAQLIIGAFITLFYSRAIGLLYAEA
ncbi:DUF4013 domain-containing protein [uncultured Methanobrevibacter sp.]|uniref:DUF4013 domain-containing protein n=1 Tax=uncultured Methanobrevibacter sp. TaxID=253161 RepID=UPI0025E00322|nr:DUF4013 domain-containing protein [uncultured Methanobrevibacter sp.]